jgi:predicted LPLAT superfamily acyltransferase/glycosyltransferase involved in cell wall biosynthesis
MTAASVRACAVIPSHNHWQAMPAIVERLRALGLAVFVIDDGSEPPARLALAALDAPGQGVRVTRLDVNRGKGAAVLAGFGLARAAGFSHCLQVDADGQHDMTAVADMLALAQNHPDAVVAGWAVYDGSAPLGRVMGRWITHVCVWIETLSFGIRDSMCGLRIYPLAAVAALIDKGAGIGEGMDFDTEIIVRLHRDGTPVVNHPVRVAYPPGNLSNFRMLRDNWRITRMHTRLLLGTLFTWPALLWKRRRRPAAATHWAGLAERGLYWGLQVSAWTYRLLGRRGCMAILSPVVLYFYLTAGERRRASLDFLSRAFAASGRSPPPGWWDGYRHFMSFARRALDSFIAWMGRMPADAVVPAEVEALEEATSQTRGAVFIVSHHGNVDISRALLDADTRRRVVVLMHTRHAENYNRILREFNPEAAINTFQVTEMGPDTAIALQQRVENGDWLFIAGDRTPVGGGRRTSAAPFLSVAAEFSQGPYLLAALLDCPVYLFFCRREGERYGLRVERLAERIVLPRGRRGEALAAYAAAYAARLEKHVLEDPFQWYNFYDFWRPSGSTAPP